MTKQEILEQFEDGFDCCQVVFGYWAKRLGLDEEIAYKVSAGFGAGMLHGENCGAVIGAYMALGLKYGNYKAGYEGEDQRVISIIKNAQFCQKFLEKYHSTMCREILGADISTREGAKQIQEQDLMNTFCSQLATDVIEMLEELIGE